MTTPEQFAITAAKRYLQNVVFVDDEIYSRDTGKPSAAIAVELPQFKAPIRRAQTTESITARLKDAGGNVQPLDMSPSKNTSVGEAAPFLKEDEDAAPTTSHEENAGVVFHPRQLVDSFAQQGIVCALYEPQKGFSTDVNSLLFKLCERADVVILDWELFGGGGNNILPLIENLANQSQNAYPHHSRLCVIYTGTPDLSRVNARIYDHLKAKNIDCDQDPSPTTLNSGSMKVVVLGKPTSGRSESQKEFEVLEASLPERIIREFAAMHTGVLPAYALSGLAAIRGNTKRILDKFHKDLDGAFLVHRAATLRQEEAFEQLPELLAEEILSVLTEVQPNSEVIGAVAKGVADKLPFSKAPWQKDGTTSAQIIESVKSFLTEGISALSGKQKALDHKTISEIHSAIGCDQSKADHRLASLFNLRTHYAGTAAPSLSFGSIVRERLQEEGHYRYSVCLMPLCDSIRLSNKDGAKTLFPFWTLSQNANGGGGKRGVVVRVPGDKYEELYMFGKARDNLWVEQFLPSENHIVEAAKENDLWVFNADGKKLEWIAQLKPAHAQRIANDVGMSLSRVAVIEAEWLRRKADAKGDER